MIDFYIPRSADFILLNQLSLILDLSLTSNLTPMPGQIVEGPLLVSKNTKELESVLSSNIIANCVTYSETQANAGLKLSAMSKSISHVTISILTNCIYKPAATATATAKFTAYPDHATALNFPGNKLAQFKEQTLDVHITTEGIFIWQPKVSKCLAALPLAILAAGRLVDDLVYITNTGLYSFTVTSILSGTSHSLLLSLTETVLDFLIDKNDFILVFSDRADFYKNYTFTAPISITDLPAGQLLNGNFYFELGGYAKVLSLPEVSGSFSNSGDIITRDNFISTPGSYPGYALPNGFGYSRSSAFSAFDGSSYVVIQYLRQLPEVATNIDYINYYACGIIGDIFWLAAAPLNFAKSQDTYTNVAYPKASNVNVFDLYTFRVTGTGAEATITFLDKVCVDDHTHVSGMGYNKDSYDYVVYPSLRIVDDQNGEPTFLFYTRPSVERTQKYTYGQSVQQATGKFHRISFNLTTGAVTDEVKVITNSKSQYPSLPYQNHAYRLNSPFICRQEDTAEALYIGNVEHNFAYKLTYSYEYIPYVVGPKCFLSFPDLTYDEPAEVTPGITRYASKYNEYLDLIDAISIDEDRVCAIEGDADGYYYASLYSKRLSNSRGGEKTLELLCEPVVIFKKPKYTYGTAQNSDYGTRPDVQEYYVFELGMSSIVSGPITTISFAFSPLKNIILRIGEDSIVPLFSTGRGYPLVKNSTDHAKVVLQDNSVFIGSTKYEDNPQLLDGCTSIVKGKDIFIISNNKLYCVYDISKSRLIHDDCVAVTVSPSASLSMGKVIITTSEGVVVIKSLEGDLPRLVTRV